MAFVGGVNDETPATRLLCDAQPATGDPRWRGGGFEGVPTAASSP
jgi:hypothetical protein